MSETEHIKGKLLAEEFENWFEDLIINKINEDSIKLKIDNSVNKRIYDEFDYKPHKPHKNNSAWIAAC